MKPTAGAQSSLHTGASGASTETERPTFRSVWRLSLPVVFLAGTDTLDHLINTTFVARLGVAELGAIGVADSILLVFCVAPLAVADVIQIVAARRAGERQTHELARAFNEGLALIVMLSAMLTVALKLASPAIAAAMMDSGQVGRLVDSFLQIAAYGIVFSGAAFAFGGLLISLGRTRVLIPATIIFVAVDVACNYVLVFGRFGLPALGMRGVAVGFLIAGFSVCLFLAGYLWLRVRSPEYPLFQFRGFHRSSWALSRLSAPLALQDLVENSRWLLFFLILERVGVEALAVGNIVYTCYVVLWIPTEGFADTTCSFVGRLVGGRRSSEVGRLVRYATSGAGLATIPFLAAAFLAPQWLGVVFSPQPAVFGESSAALRIAALGMIVTIPAAIYVSALLGTGDTPAVFLVELVLTCTMLAAAYTTAVLWRWPVSLIWLSLPFAWMVAFGLTYGWVKSGLWRRVKV